MVNMKKAVIPFALVLSAHSHAGIFDAAQLQKRVLEFYTLVLQKHYEETYNYVYSTTRDELAMSSSDEDKVGTFVRSMYLSPKSEAYFCKQGKVELARIRPAPRTSSSLAFDGDVNDVALVDIECNGRPMRSIWALDGSSWYFVLPHNERSD